MATIPIVPDTSIIDANGKLVDEWQDFFNLLTQALRNGVGNEGFEIPRQDEANITVIQNNQTVQPGKLIFDTDAINGGTMENPNGQLVVKLADGTFHPITNS